MPARSRRPSALLATVAVTALVAFGSPAAHAGPIGAPAEAGWLPGDLHVHTYWSHDVCETPLVNHDGTPCDAPYTWGFSPRKQIRNAELRGLQYLALTDHNTVAQQTDPGYHSSLLTLIPAYENSLSGHAQMLGADHVYAKGDGGAAAVNAMVDALHANGGVFQINHPMDPKWGYGPEVSGFDSIEVWNIAWPNQRDIMGDSLVASNNDEALGFYDRWLDTGKHAAATGGSDSHWRLTTAIQGPGEPTTWVFSADHSVAAILAGIRAGRTFVTANPPALHPTTAYLEADANHDGAFETMVGGTVPAASDFRIRVRGGLGNFVRVVATGSHQLAKVPVTSNNFTYAFHVPAGTTWVRTEVFIEDLAGKRQGLCLNKTLPGDDAPRCFEGTYWMSALTSPIYISG